MQGIFVKGARPKSKKLIRETVAESPGHVTIEATSLFGNEYDGPLDLAPNGSYHFCGPNPHDDRRFYGTIVKSHNQIIVK